MHKGLNELNRSVMMSNMVPKAARPMILGSDDFWLHVTTIYISVW